MEVTVTRAGASCSVSMAQVGQLPERTKPWCGNVCMLMWFGGWSVGERDVCKYKYNPKPNPACAIPTLESTHQADAHEHGIGEGAADPAGGREGEEGRGGDRPEGDHAQQPERALPGP